MKHNVEFKLLLPAQQPLVTEATIRRAFEAHGELEHVAIRTHKYADTVGLFIHTFLLLLSLIFNFVLYRCRACKEVTDL